MEEEDMYHELEKQQEQIDFDEKRKENPIKDMKFNIRKKVRLIKIWDFQRKMREEVRVRLAGRLLGRQPLQRRGVVGGRVG